MAVRAEAEHAEALWTCDSALPGRKTQELWDWVKPMAYGGAMLKERAAVSATSLYNFSK
jgi:hypothetical protein